MGAPARNANAIQHGLLTAGSLPAGAGYVKRVTIQLRNAIEQAVIDRKGELSLCDAATAQTALRWERHALLAQRWLRNQFAELTADQRLSFSREIARASAERDKCLRALSLDRDRREGLFDSLYSQIRDADAETPDDADQDDQPDSDADHDAESEAEGPPDAAEDEDDEGSDTIGPDDGRTIATQAEGNDRPESNVLDTSGDAGIAPDDALALDADPTIADAMAHATATLDGVNINTDRPEEATT